MPKILIVDDEPSIREAVGAVVTTAGHLTHLARNGREGLAHFDEFQPDLVITDIVMPDMEGIGLIRELRRQRPDLPIIAMSGGAGLGPISYLRMAHELGASRTLEKPVSPAVMLSAIRELLPARG